MKWFDKLLGRSVPTEPTYVYLVIRRDHLHVGVFTDPKVADECATANPVSDVWTMQLDKDYSL